MRTQGEGRALRARGQEGTALIEFSWLAILLLVPPTSIPMRMCCSFGTWDVG